MGRIFSNSPLKDFVVNPYAELVAGSAQISVMSPFVTRVEELIDAARSGKRVDLLVGLNSSTSPAALAKAQQQHGIEVRYYAHHRFHAKVYLFDRAAIIGSSNLTDAGLKYNREAAIALNDDDDSADIVELRAVFDELWDAAAVLTDDVLKRFSEAHQRFRSSNVDETIA
jgi:HKD family nuclease